jgi:hypothetical protein
MVRGISLLSLLVAYGGSSCIQTASAHLAGPGGVAAPSPLLTHQIERYISAISAGLAVRGFAFAPAR